MFHVEQGWTEALREDAAQLSISLGDEQIAQFQQYLEELVVWNKKINLTSITDAQEIAVKHFIDSLACCKALLSGSLLDIGSGAGFPGLPLKILNPDLELGLLEPTHKKSAFLHHIIGTLGLKQVQVYSRRLEDLSADPNHWDRYVNAITRALDVLPFLRLIRPLMKKEGRLVLCRAEPLRSLDQPNPFLISEEIAYTLPHGLGDRVLTVLVPR
jgi:16S rRNA (guanine527-N7)-methyltransferase